MMQLHDRPVRIAGASGAASDRRHAMAVFARNVLNEPVDVIINDYLSEANMATAAGRKFEESKNVPSYSSPGVSANGAFEPSFLEALEPALSDLARYGTKVVVNAGASDTEGLFRVIMAMLKRHKLDKRVHVAWIDGDDVLPVIKKGLQSGIPFQNVYTGHVLADWNFDPISAQAYLGGMGIAEAFRQGAQIVICGRVADASPVIGAACWWHNWQQDDFNLLANALVAGHLIECSTYVTGGNYTGFKVMQTSKSWVDIGFPIAEINRNGQVIITKQKNTGGLVSVDTCSSQLLYEIQGPWYFNSDVTAILNDIWLEQLGPDRVAVHGVKGSPPPPTTKVGITAVGGYQAEVYYFLTGLDIPEKANMLEDQVRHLLAASILNLTHLSFDVIGTPAPNATNQNAATAILRIFAQARKSEHIAPSRFLKPIIDNVMQGYPGATFHLDFRQGIPKQYFEYYVCLLEQASIKHVVHFNRKQIKILPPSMTKLYPERQPSQVSTAIEMDLSTFGPTERMPLGTIAHARSGDKGSDCNCGFWVRTHEEYAWLKNLLSVSRMEQLLGEEYDRFRVPKIEIERFELHNLRGVHFLFRNLLDRGVNSTATIDFLGKNCAEFLRSRHVDVPIKFLTRGKL